MYIQYEWDTGNKRESVTHVRVMDSLYFSCRIIIVDHRLNTCCAFLPFDLESVKVCLSRSKFVKNPEKYVKMYYAYISSNGKGMYNMKDIQNAIYSIVEARGKNVTAFYVMRLTLQSIINQICRRCTSSAMKSASGQESAPTKQFRGR